MSLLNNIDEVVVVVVEHIDTLRLIVQLFQREITDVCNSHLSEYLFAVSYSTVNTVTRAPCWLSVVLHQR